MEQSITIVGARFFCDAAGIITATIITKQCFSWFIAELNRVQKNAMASFNIAWLGGAVIFCTVMYIWIMGTQNIPSPTIYVFASIALVPFFVRVFYSDEARKNYEETKATIDRS